MGINPQIIRGRVQNKIHLLKQSNISQKSISKSLGVSENTVSLWATGQTTPSAYNRKRLYALYGRRGRGKARFPVDALPSMVSSRIVEDGGILEGEWFNHPAAIGTIPEYDGEKKVFHARIKYHLSGEFQDGSSFDMAGFASTKINVGERLDNRGLWGSVQMDITEVILKIRSSLYLITVEVDYLKVIAIGRV